MLLTKIACLNKLKKSLTSCQEIPVGRVLGQVQVRVTCPSHHAPVAHEDETSADNGADVKDLMITEVGGNGIGPFIDEYSGSYRLE